MGKETHAPTRVDVRAELTRLKRKATRMDAVSRLVAARASDAVEPLLSLCQRAEKAERKTIYLAIAEIGTEGSTGAVVESLVKAGLGSRNARVRRYTLRALGLMGHAAQAAYEDVLRCLQDESPSVRSEAIAALGQLGDPRAVEPLVAYLANEDRVLRTHAVEALVGLGAVAIEAVGRIFSSAGSADPKTDKKAARALARTRIAAAYVLGQIGCERAEGMLREVFLDRGSPPGLRVAILEALSTTMHERIIPLAKEALRDRDSQVHRQAVRCLSDIDTPESTAQLIRVYTEGADLSDPVRALALKGLRQRRPELIERIRSGEHSALAVLLAIWRDLSREGTGEGQELLRDLASVGRVLVPALCASLSLDRPGRDTIQVLEKLGPAAGEAYPALVSQLDNPDLATCCAAARALGAIGDERAVSVLAACLSGEVHLVSGEKPKKRRQRARALQQAAAAGLGSLGKVALVSALDAAQSDHPFTRRGGVMALGYIGGGQALRALDKAGSDDVPAVREAAAKAIERAAAGDVTRLNRLLQDKDERVRIRAIRAMGKLGDLRSLDLLLRAYGDASDGVNKAVVKALARREGGRASSLLIVAAAGGNVSALRALERHVTPEAIPALIEALDSPWHEVYGAALRTIRTYIEVLGVGPLRPIGGPEVVGGAGEAGQADQATALLRQAIPYLRSLLHDDSPAIRRLALQALGAFRGQSFAGLSHAQQAIPDVATLLMDRKKDIRFAALQTIESIGGEGAIAVLRAYADREQRRGEVDEDLHAEIDQVLQRLSGSTATCGSAKLSPCNL